ncbi:unnamed protein product [Cochlearia groenlandica]
MFPRAIGPRQRSQSTPEALLNAPSGRNHHVLHPMKINKALRFVNDLECMESISQRISKKKSVGKKSTYISETDWVLMLEKWDTTEFQSRSATNYANKMSNPDGQGGHKHCVGPVSYAKIWYDMALSLIFLVIRK